MMDHNAMMNGADSTTGGHVMEEMTGMGGMDMMKMYFHFGTEATILFSGWKTKDWQGMLGSCVGIFIFTMLYEGLKVGREVLLRRYPTDDRHCSVKSLMFRQVHLLQTLLHIIQIICSYFLMLIFMTFNMWLCIAVALGAGAGYFFFAWNRALVEDPNEHCH